MKRLKVYRYEHSETGVGPYQTKDTYWGDYVLVKERMIEHHSGHRHPSVMMDFANWDNSLVCGCLSARELKSWFWGYNQVLKKAGFVVVEYSVPGVMRSFSGRQVGFLRGAHRRVCRGKRC